MSNNLEKAKAVLKEKTKENDEVEKLLNPPPVPPKKIKIMPRKDIDMAERILTDKLDKKIQTYGEEQARTKNQQYKTEIIALYQKAIDLKKEAMALSKTVEQETGGMIKASFETNNYGRGFWASLPDSISEAKEDDFFDVERDQKNSPQIKEMREEIDNYILNLKIGNAELIEIRALLNKIDQVIN